MMRKAKRLSAHQRCKRIFANKKFARMSPVPQHLARSSERRPLPPVSPRSFLTVPDVNIMEPLRLLPTLFARLASNSKESFTWQKKLQLQKSQPLLKEQKRKRLPKLAPMVAVAAAARVVRVLRANRKNLLISTSRSISPAFPKRLRAVAAWASQPSSFRAILKNTP